MKKGRKSITMSEKLNMAIAGIGRIGVTHLAVLNQTANMCLKAIVEPREEVGRKAGGEEAGL